MSGRLHNREGYPVVLVHRSAAFLLGAALAGTILFAAVAGWAFEPIPVGHGLLICRRRIRLRHAGDIDARDQLLQDPV